MRRLVALPAVVLALGAGCLAAHAARSDPAPRDPGGGSALRLGAAGPWAVYGRLSWDEVPGAAHAAGEAARAPPDAQLGLFPGEHFELATGRCADCPPPEAALRYFRDELIAVPRAGLPVSGAVSPAAGELPYPPLVWLGAPEVAEGVLSADGRTLHTAGGAVRFALAAPIATNRSYADGATLAFLAGRRLRVRGVTLAHAGEPLFVARTIWPEDTRIAPDALVLRPMRPGETFSTLVRAQDGESREFYDKRLLWERRPDARRDWAGRPVLAFVLNGAQGDDDGAHGGHLGVATGRLGPRGQWGDWLVANYYPLDERSEKGILTAPVPMDNYMMDLNSGQAFYRPNYVLVAILREPGVARRVQAALQDVFHGYWCGEIEYHRGRHNSTALSMDALRALGWNIPQAGATSHLLGLLAAPVATVVQRSFAGGREVFDMFVTEKTRGVPRVAFEAAGHDLLRLLDGAGGGAPRELTAFERMLADEVEAVLFLRFPQVPSSRRQGTYPVESLFEFAARVPWRGSERESGPQGGEWPFPPEPAQPCPSAPRTDDARP